MSTMLGGTGKSTMLGNREVDYVGEPGSRLCWGTGKSTMLGNREVDFVGGTGKSIMLGEPGSRLCWGNREIDYVGEPGSRLCWGTGKSTMLGNREIDYVGEPGSRLCWGTGKSTMLGNREVDYVGGTGKSTLLGEPGSRLCWGNREVDFVGGTGKSTMLGNREVDYVGEPGSRLSGNSFMLENSEIRYVRDPGNSFMLGTPVIVHIGEPETEIRKECVKWVPLGLRAGLSPTVWVIVKRASDNDLKQDIENRRALRKRFRTFSGVRLQYHTRYTTLPQHRLLVSVHVVPESSDLRCDVCGRDFDRRSRLEAHYKTHTGERPFSCPFCGKSFASKGNCNTHMRVHTRERPYQCPHCEKKFSQHGQLVIHIRRHTGEKPYVCPHCNKGFTCSKVLKIHVRTHTGEKPFQCEYCHKGFAAYANLVVHRRIHTRERPYACHLCGRAFEHSGNLSRHVRVHRVDGGVRCIPCGQVFSCEQDLVAHTAHHHPNEHTREDEADPDGPSPPAPSTINLQDLEQFQPPHGYQPPACEPQLTLLTPLAPSPPSETALPQPSEAEDAPSEARGCITLSDSEDSGRESGGSTGYATSPDQAFERQAHQSPETTLKAEAPEAAPPDTKPPGCIISTTTHRDGVRETLATTLPSAMPAPAPHIRMPPKKQQYPGGGRTPLSVLRAALSTQRPNPSIAQAPQTSPLAAQPASSMAPPPPLSAASPPISSLAPPPLPMAPPPISTMAPPPPSSLAPPLAARLVPPTVAVPSDAAFPPEPSGQNSPHLNIHQLSLGHQTSIAGHATPVGLGAAPFPRPCPSEAETHGGDASAERLSPLYRSSPRPQSPLDADANPLDLSRPPGPHGGGGGDASPLNLSQRLAGAHHGSAESCLVGYGSQAASGAPHLLAPAPPLTGHLLTTPLPAPSSSRSNILRRKSADVAHADPKKNKSRKVAPPPLIPIRGTEEAPTPAPSSRPPEALAHHHPSSMPAAPPSSSACHPYRAHIPSAPTSAPSTLVSYAPALSTTCKTSHALPSSLSPPLSSYAPHSPPCPRGCRCPSRRRAPSSRTPTPTSSWSPTCPSSSRPRSRASRASSPTRAAAAAAAASGEARPSPLESMRENIQRSLLSLLPGEHEAASFKRKVETALVVLVGEAPMKQLGYPEKTAEQVLITILDMAGKGPCADVRVDELHRLKVNMRKFLEYGFPSRTSWEELGWSGRSIDSIMDNIISWISQRQNSGLKGLHVGFLEKGGGIGV
ncbi:LOW QUALITY PROTEIN: uncharacterized protein LOC125043476 [Penaeus chinensis]|uniref:LOW QUALITY PROTEIN: uncharacterized protein LOC125043476 n=1 Tax=Penaeus chinensis TaxID=139456 RepID=UPI001FB635F8|nr:LOW QUALITY PROTEIN: uncharacterized protein LOC125043476 [Penaeus chinensis]